MDPHKPFTVASVMPAPAEPRRRWLWPVLAALVVVLAALAVVLLVRRPEVAPTTAAAPPASPSTSVATAKDPVATEACKKAATVDIGDLAGMVALGNQVKAAGGVTTEDDATIRFRAQMVGDRAELAIAAKGQSDEVELTLDAATSLMDLHTACIRGGY